MNIHHYKTYMTAEMLMGPNSARILEALWIKHPLQLHPDQRILDLGCGKGLTSLILAKETGAKVYANDLWVSAEDNKQRFEDWGVKDQITPVCEDANRLSFPQKQFDSLVSIDSYHYFATEIGFFETKILPFLKNEAVVLIGIPGVKEAYTGRSTELLSEWLGNEAYMFKSSAEWREIIGNHERMETVETWELGCFDLAWDEWFATGHKYALEDQQFFETLIRPYTCFVGIYIKLK